MASGYGDGPVIIPLYGVPIRDVIKQGDPDLMKAMLKVSDYMLSQAEGGLADWKAAHSELKKAAG